jgi:hypothetical protein
MADRYNGWTNYETWNLKLWIDNDQGLYAQWQEAAHEAIGNTNATDDLATRKREAAEELAEQLAADTAAARPACEGFYGDVLGAAIGAIDYREIAEALIVEVSE